MYYLLSFIPVILDIILNICPTTYLETNCYDLWKIIRVIILYFTPVIIPIYITILYVFFTKFSKKYKIKRWIGIAFFTVVILINILVKYLLTPNPDGFTIAICVTMAFFALLIGYSGIGIFELVYWIINRKKS